MRNIKIGIAGAVIPLVVIGVAGFSSFRGKTSAVQLSTVSPLGKSSVSSVLSTKDVTMRLSDGCKADDRVSIEAPSHGTIAVFDCSEGGDWLQIVGAGPLFLPDEK